MRPKTFVENMLSMSDSAISPTFSTPRTKPALLTDMYDESQVERRELQLTKDVNVAKLGGDFVPELRDLAAVRDVELDAGELAASRHARLLVCGNTLVLDLLERILTTRHQDHIGASLINVSYEHSDVLLVYTPWRRGSPSPIYEDRQPSEADS